MSIGERRHGEIATEFYAAANERSGEFLATARGLGPDAIRSHPETLRLSTLAKGFVRGTRVVRVAIHDEDGLTLFSTAEDEIGAYPANRRDLDAARAGQLTATRMTKTSFQGVDGKAADRKLVESFVPVRGPDGKQAIISLYSDATGYHVIVEGNLVILIAVVVGALFAVLGMLIFYVGRDRVLTEQQQRNVALTESVRLAEEASRLKSRFVASMGHELRTPLNAIIGFTELLHDGKVGAVSDRQKEFLGDVLTSSQHLLQLINDVLDLSKIEAGKMEFRPEPADMAKLAGEVRDILRTLAAGKRIRVETDVTRLLGDVVIDPARFKQVLYNFVSNALKFTPDEGRVAIRVKPEGAEKFRLEVEDTGIGVRPEDLSKLFSEFRQLDAGMAKKHGGTGLGLALTKRIVEAQGGRVGVESTPGKGSLFYAVLPRAAKAERQEETPPALMTPRAGAASVLVIDDDSKDRAWLLETLSKAGYAVEPAPSGFEALALCRQRKFDAITLDLLLPDMSGWDVLRAIRKEETNRDTPVIVVTVVAEKGVGIGFPIHDVLVKPVDAADLLASIGGAGVLPDGTHKVLAVDDNPRDLRLLGEVLRQLGYRPICQPDGESALAAAAAERPSAIVLDLVMPGVDGFEFLRRLRQTADGRRTPVIVWTSKDLTAEERAGLRAAAQAVVAKGNGTSALLEELRTWAPVPS